MNQDLRKKALVLGATGMVGSLCLKKLLELDCYDVIYAPTRRELDIKSDKLINPIVDFEKLDKDSDFFKIDDLYCCLGTTMAKARSKEAFTFVDFSLITECAKYARQGNCQNMGVISSLGSSVKALSFYLKIKGEMENSLQNIGFTSLHIMRPSLLLGKRKEKRRVEGISIKASEKLSFIFKGKLAKYKPIQAKDVANFMIECVLSRKKGTNIYESVDIPRLDA